MRLAPPVRSQRRPSELSFGQRVGTRSVGMYLAESSGSSPPALPIGESVRVVRTPCIGCYWRGPDCTADGPGLHPWVRDQSSSFSAHRPGEQRRL